MIVDASALLLLPLPPEGNPVAPARLEAVFRRILDWDELRAPLLAAYEAGHVIHRKRPEKVGRTVEERTLAYQRLRAYADFDATPPELLVEAGQLAERVRMSFYDAVYVSQAILQREALLTADAGLQAHAEALGLRAYLLPRDLGRLEADYPSEPEAPAPRR